MPLRVPLAVGFAVVCTILPLMSAGSRPREPLEVGTLAAIQTDGRRAVFDLSFEQPGQRYLLIVSSMARRGGPFKIEATAAPLERAELLPLVPQGRETRDESRERGQGSGFRVQEAAARAVPLSRLSSLDPRLSTLDSQPSTVNSQLAARTFYLHVADRSPRDPTAYARVEGELAYEGRYVRVYRDGSDPAVGAIEDLAQEVAHTFDKVVYPTVSGRLGEHLDFDGDGKFTILLTNWLGQLGGGATSVGGFVRGSDFSRGMGPPFSNRCDMMFLNAGLAPGEHLRTVLVHEYTHAVTFSARLAASDWVEPTVHEEDWLNEAISHVAENLLGNAWTNLDYRISAYLSAPQEYPLVVPDYYGADLWRSHGCRGATYLFLRWCTDQYGMEVVRRLIRGDARGIENVEAATGERFDELYRRWTAWLFLEGSGIGNSANVAAPRDGRSFVHPREPLGDWALAGPRYERWPIDERKVVFDLPRTATQYVIVEGIERRESRDESRERVQGSRFRVHEPGSETGALNSEPRTPPAAFDAAHITIEADEGAALQVSLVRLPADMGSLELEARLARGSGGAHHLDLALRETAGTGVAIDFLGWEPLVPERRAPAECVPVCLGEESVYEVFGSSSIEGCGRMAGRTPPLSGNLSAPILVKVAGTDARGRRVSAFCVVEPREAPPATLAQQP